MFALCWSPSLEVWACHLSSGVPPVFLEEHLCVGYGQFYQLLLRVYGHGLTHFHILYKYVVILRALSNILVPSGLGQITVHQFAD